MDDTSDKANLKAWGNAEDSKVVVYIRKDVHDAIYRHGKANPEREVGGILVGSVSEDSLGKYRVDIVGAVQAESAPGTQAQVQFTGAAWGQLVASAQRDYPNQKVVGWYHTHPGFGVFLSDDDIASHRVAFSNPWHVAAVCDPVRDELCLFGWDESEIKAIKGFYTYEAPTKEPAPLPRRERRPTSQGKILAFLVPAVALSMVVLGVMMVRLAGLSGRPPFEESPAAVASFSDQQADDKASIHNYYILANRKVWRRTEEWRQPRPTWQQEEDLPITLTEMEANIFRNSDGAGRIGTLEVEGQDKDGNRAVFEAAIIKTGALTSWEGKPSEGAPAPPELSAYISMEPSHLDFGETEDTRTLEITVRGAETFPWTLSADKPWIKPADLPGSESATVTVEIDRRSLASGEHTGVITVDWDGGTETISVSVTVPEEPKAPEFHIEWIEDKDRSGKISSRGEMVRVHVSNQGEAAGDVQLEAEFDDDAFAITSWPDMECQLEPEGEHTFELLVDPENVGDTSTLTCRVKNLQRDNRIDDKLEKEFGVE